MRVTEDVPSVRPGDGRASRRRNHQPVERLGVGTHATAVRLRRDEGIHHVLHRRVARRVSEFDDSGDIVLPGEFIPQTVIPFYVATNMSRIRRTSLFTPDGQTYASAALNTLGVMAVTHGCWPHQLQVS